MIDWSALADAVAFYRTLGYHHVEVPWTAPEEAINTTLPPGATPMVVPYLGTLVGSAEQSFVGLDMQGKLDKGRFVACTPCFRLGDDDGDLHQPCFMKVELYINDVVDELTMFEMMGHAGTFFRHRLHRRGKGVGLLRHVQTQDGWDLEIGGIEVGSYGLRSTSGVSWVYGTGCAEPRLSKALERA